MEKMSDKDDNMKTGKSKRNAGYTLIETLVSGVLLIFAVTAAVAVVGTGTQLGSSDNDRRQARAVLRSIFEQNYDYRNFNTIPASLDFAEQVVIDERFGNPLVGNLTHTVRTENVLTGGGTTFPVRRVELKLQWNNVDNVADSISLSKLVANP
jgi:type II secretory pathway pseudopilin PulG